MLRALQRIFTCGTPLSIAAWKPLQRAVPIAAVPNAAKLVESVRLKKSWLLRRASQQRQSRRDDDIHAVVTVMRSPRLLVVLLCLLPVRSEVVKCDLSEMVPAHIRINRWDVNTRRQRVITPLSECRTLNDLASRRSADTTQQMVRLASNAAHTEQEETSAF